MQFVERMIMEIILDRAAKQNFFIRVHDMEEWATDYLNPATNRGTILQEAPAADECRLYFYKKTDVGYTYQGWIYIIFGEGDTMITDYTVGLEDFVKPIDKEIFG